MPKINSTYDVGAAFEAIEKELIASMIRNMKRHKVEEVAEDMEWTMWQTEQLHALERYRKENQKKFSKRFSNINAQIEALLQIANADGQMSQEAAILRAIKNGFPARRVGKGATAEFFRLNERKLNALIGATMNDMQRAEVAVLRMANDQYRKVIFNAQMYANTGAATYEKAVDMATKDFAAAGLNCVQYSNGARHTLADYADMAIRTAAKRAYLQGEGTKRQEWGIHTVIVNKRSDRGPGGVCPQCLPFVGKVFIDDVWSGGKRSDGPYPLISTAIEAGLYHPRCKDSHTTYFPGVSAPPDDSFTKKDLQEIEETEKETAKQQNAELQAKKWQSVADTRLDPENRQAAQQKADEWKEKAEGQIHFDPRISDRQKELLQSLAGEYRTRLQNVTVGAEKAAGDVDMSGSRMRLSDKRDHTTIHEFAHSLANYLADKYGLTKDKEFWKEIKAIRRKYLKDVENDPSRWISTYEHSGKSIDEFMAEAFTHAKMRELGLSIPDKYGKDFTYSQQVLDTINKFFRRETERPGSINLEVFKQIEKFPDGRLFKSDPYEVLGTFSSDMMKLLEKEIGPLQTDEIIVMEERLRHIKERHPQDYDLFGTFGKDCIFSPDLILAEDDRPGSVLMIKRAEDRNLNVVMRLALTTDTAGYKNSVITFFKMRDKSLKSRIKNSRIIYAKSV